MSGISTWGAYVPRLRLSRSAVVAANAWIAPQLASKGKGERAMANWDEDALTMSVEAARDALGPADDRDWVDAIYLASTTLPFADRLNAGVASAALTLRKGVSAMDVTGSQRCGLTALAQALLAADAKGAHRSSLVCSAEMKRSRAASAQELDSGDGAAAFVVTGEAGAAEFIGHGVVTADFVDHFRLQGAAFDYVWEERWIRDVGVSRLLPEAITAALESAGLSGAEVTHFCMPSVFPGIAKDVASRCAIPSSAIHDNLALTVGDTGAAHGLVMLAGALDEASPGDVVLVAQFGQGAEALVFRVTEAVAERRPARGVSGALADRREEQNYLKFLFFRNLVEWERGMRGEKDNGTALTTLYRNSDAILGLVGGVCRETGVVQFPRSRISVGSNFQHVDTQDPYKFAERGGRLVSLSSDFLGFSVNPPNRYGVVDFDGGGRMPVDITDAEGVDLHPQARVRMMFRLKEVDMIRGFRRYFWKAVPDCRGGHPKISSSETL